MTELKITIGYTRTDRDHDYVPSTDGYRPGATQDRIELIVLDPPEITDQRWAEAVFVATNEPEAVGSVNYPGSDEVDEALALVRVGVTSLSVGDTVSIKRGSATTHTYACLRAGWDLLDPE